MNQSEQINELATALAKAQGQITGALKDSSNPFFKSKYADLAACWDACRKQLSENGLSVIQTTDYDEGGLHVVTTLAHSSGQWIRGRLLVKCKDDGPQAQGSGLTYARRYALAAMVGLAQIDDDAESAQGRDNGEAKARDAEKAARSKATKKANEYADRIIQALGMDLEDAAADVMREAKDESEQFATDVWHALSTPIRNRLREISNRKAA